MANSTQQNQVAKWLGLAVALAGMIVGAVVAVQSRPSRPEVQRMVQESEQQTRRETRLQLQSVDLKLQNLDDKMDAQGVTLDRIARKLGP